MTIYYRDETRNGFTILAPDDPDKDWQVILGTLLHDNDPVFEGSQAECQAYIERASAPVPLKKFRVNLFRSIVEAKTVYVEAVDEAAVKAQLAQLYTVDEGDGWEANGLCDTVEGEHQIEFGEQSDAPDWIIGTDGQLHEPAGDPDADARAAYNADLAHGRD